MSCGCVHIRLSSTALVRCERVDILKHNSQQGLSLLESLKKTCGGLTLQFKLRFSSQHPNQFQAVVTECYHPQNKDLPRYYSKNEKKPFPIPIIELRRDARERFKNSKDQRRGIPPPKRGLVVQRLVPVAYSVMNARIKLNNNLEKLLKVVPVHSCGVVKFMLVLSSILSMSCTGSQASVRKGHHEWGETVLEDILISVDAYHLYDRLGKRISHEERFFVPRIPAVLELCIQAGVNLPEYPTKWRRKPIIRIGKKEFIDADESELPDPDPEVQNLQYWPKYQTLRSYHREETMLLAVETLQAWEEIREGAKRLTKMYPVRACGYCPEVHVGLTGHKAQRNGQHGWHASVLDDLVPPQICLARS